MTNNESRKGIFSDILRGISRTERILWSDTERFLDLSITEAQRQALFVVAETGQMTVGAIAKRLGVTNGAVTQLVDGLVRIDVVERKTDTVDARKVQVCVTKHGAEKLQSLHQSYQEKFADIFRDATNEELQMLLDIQKHVFAYSERSAGRSH